MANICIITSALGKSGRTPLWNLTELCSRIANKVILISGGEALKKFDSRANVEITRVFQEPKLEIIKRIVENLRIQIEIAYLMLSLFRKIDFFIFYIGGESLLLPVILKNLSVASVNSENFS